jgi:hypothetical protein
VFLTTQNKIPGYERWAVQARNEVEGICRNRREDEMKCLDGNLQVIVGSLHEQVENLQREVSRYNDSFSLLTSKVQEMSIAQTRESLAVLQCTTAMSSQMTSLVNGFSHHFQQLQIQQQQQQQQPQHQQPLLPVAAVALPPQQQQDNNQFGVDAANQVLEAVEEEAKEAVEEEGKDEPVAADMDLQDRMRITPRQPDIGSKMPRSWLLAVEEWETLSLAAFKHSNHRLWTGSDVRCRYNKRRSAIEEVERRRSDRQTNETLFEVAAQLDEERERMGLTVCRHLAYLRSTNPGIGRRARAGQFLGVAERADILGPPLATRPPRQRPRRPHVRHHQVLAAQQQHRQLPMQPPPTNPLNRFAYVQPTVGNGRFQAGEQGLRMTAALQLEARDGARQRAAAYRRAVGNNAALLDEVNVEALRRIRNGEDLPTAHR